MQAADNQSRADQYAAHAWCCRSTTTCAGRRRPWRPAGSGAHPPQVQLCYRGASRVCGSFNVGAGTSVHADGTMERESRAQMFLPDQPCQQGCAPPVNCSTFAACRIPGALVWRPCARPGAAQQRPGPLDPSATCRRAPHIDHGRSSTAFVGQVVLSEAPRTGPWLSRAVTCRRRRPLSLCCTLLVCPPLQGVDCWEPGMVAGVHAVHWCRTSPLR